MLNFRTRLLTATALCGCMTFASSAFAAPPSVPAPTSGAQPAPSGAATAPPPAAAQPAGPMAAPNGESTDPVERARVHYERGLQLFNEENYTAALFEFERAYELAPSYKILYNMGRIQRQQNNYAAALRSYARYLSEGGAGVPPERRTEVEREIAVLTPRVAKVNVTVNVDDADVYSDDTPVCTATIESSCAGKSPLKAPIIVNGGRHKITAVKPGYAPATSLVSVVGSDTIDVKLEMVSLARNEGPVDPAPRTRAIVSWVVTGAFAASAVVTGVLALRSSSKLDDIRSAPNADAGQLSSQSTKTKTFALATDVLGAVAIVGGVISTYFTIKAFQAGRKSDDPAAAPLDKTAKVRFDFGPSGAMVLGQF
jgi:hypothetical protein